MEHYIPIRELLHRVRARWRALVALHALVRGSLVAAAIVGAAWTASRWLHGSPAALVVLAAITALLTLGALAWALLPLRRVPGDKQVARYIEEREPSLGDRLVTAVDVAEAQRPPALAAMMMADAARRAASVDVEQIVPAESLRRAGFQTAAAVLVFGSVLFVARDTARQAIDSASLTLFPGRVALTVSPGNTKVKIGSPMEIQARLVGNRAPVLAQVQIADGDGWRNRVMTRDAAGSFHLAMPSVSGPIKYRVVAGAVASPTYEIAVAIPPHVARIDVHYTYPEGLRLPPRTETDGGDIYAPAGTDVRVQVFTDRPAAGGQMMLGAGKPIVLAADGPQQLSASLKVTSDDSYRLVLADREGIGNAGDTEYFIRMLEDRPPDVRVLKPATDRSVTRLEEVDIEAQAEDDYGVDRLDLVYSVKGGAEKVVPLTIPKASVNVTGRHLLSLEDLDVEPGDFVSYYVRARDLTRGTRPNEARSDIFFLEVKPYEQEFALAQSQGNMPGGNQSGIDDLVAAQKEIVVATWKLDRRGRAAKGARSDDDIKAVARAEAELKTRVEQTSSSFREGVMRDPKRRAQPPRGRGGPGLPPQPPAPPPTPELKAGETMPEEDQMTAAAMAMAQAVTSLDASKTTEALPPEMDALNRLLKAQAEVKRREVQRQQSGSGNAGNRSNYDVSSLFDKELQKAQQTNYENRSTSAEQKSETSQSALDAIKELARRQDELLKKQQELARQRAQMSEEELKRELEKLTREQSELRQKAEELARNMASKGQDGQEGKKGQDGQKGQQGQPGQQSQAGQSGKSGQAGQAGESGQSGQSPETGDSKRMRDVSEEMRNAASGLRRQDPGEASARGSRALDKLRQMQQQLESARPENRQRALGDMQLEARQLADAERQVASELARSSAGEAGKDSVRKLAGEQDRLADRAARLTEALKAQGSQGAQGSRGAQGAQGAQGSGGQRGADAAQTQAAATAVAKDIERQRLSERMKQTADAMRTAIEEPKGGSGNTAARSSGDPRAQASTQQELAAALEKAADKLASAAGSQDAESQKLSQQRARAQELRDRLNETTRALGQMAQQGQPGAGKTGQAGGSGRAGNASQSASAESAQKSAGDSGRAGQGQAGGGGTGTDLEKLREQYQRQLQETRERAEQMRRDDPSFARGGGGGFSFEAPTSIGLSAPGTEAFKQDFAKWEEMRRQATQLLDNVEASLSKRLQAKQAHDRLAAGADDKAPAGYQTQVDEYFKAIAGKKKP